MSNEEIAWLAGLYEGEATFGLYKNRIRIVLAMTDRDIIQRAYDLLGSGSFNPEKPKVGNPNYKPLFVFSMAAQEDCRQFLSLIRPLMGERRGEKIDTLLAHVEENPSKWNVGEGGTHGGQRKSQSGCPCEACETARENHRAKGRANYAKRVGRPVKNWSRYAQDKD